MQWLLYAVLAYLAACYLGGLYLAMRLTLGRRLRRVLARKGGRVLAPGSRAPAAPGSVAAPADSAHSHLGAGPSGSHAGAGDVAPVGAASRQAA